MDQISQLSAIVELLLVAPEKLLLRDTYFDTADRQLSAAQLALRLREIGGRCLIGLKGPEEDAADGMRRMEHEALWTPMALTKVLQLIADYGIPINEPQGAGFTQNPARVIESLGLEPIQVRDTERLCRDLVDPAEPSVAIAELAVDTVRYHLPGRQIAHHEVETELKAAKDAAILSTVGRELQGTWGELTPWIYSKYATGWAAARLLEMGILTDHVAASGYLRPAAYDLIANWLSESRD